MNRSIYYNFIESKLIELATRIEQRGSLNIQDLHLHAENFYRDFCNLLFGWQLENLNKEQPNAPGIDLIDNSNNIVVQVSSTATRQKIESSLTKDISNYSGYSFKYISISKDAKNLRDKTYQNPHNLAFLPANDIFDVSSLLRLIDDMDIRRLKNLYEFIKAELKSEPDPDKIESNLTTIIKILAKEDWSADVAEFEKIPYDVEVKISYNYLETAKPLIDDHKIHYPRIDKIYSDFDTLGVNKSLSILNGIRMMYYGIINSDSDVSSDQCFFLIIQQVIEKIQASANYMPMPVEELSLCVEILVVDAFIRCKIFKNPSGGINADS